MLPPLSSGRGGRKSRATDFGQLAGEAPGAQLPPFLAQYWLWKSAGPPREVSLIRGWDFKAVRAQHRLQAHRTPCESEPGQMAERSNTLPADARHSAARTSAARVWLTNALGYAALYEA